MASITPVRGEGLDPAARIEVVNARLLSFIVATTLGSCPVRLAMAAEAACRALA